MTHSGDASAADLVLAMTGASGAPYAIRLLRVLCASGRNVHLSITPSAAQVLDEEIGLRVNLNAVDQLAFGRLGNGKFVYHHYQDFSAGIASGSFLTA